MNFHIGGPHIQCIWTMIWSWYNRWYQWYGSDGSWMTHIDRKRDYGSIQTLFREILKSLNIVISTGPSDSSSKMIQKTENIRSRDCRNFRKFSIQSFETLTRFSGNTVCWNWNLTGPCERGRRDLFRLVLWRYTDMALIGVFMILLNRSNRRLSKISNHKLSQQNFYIFSKFLTRDFLRRSVEIVLII